MSGPGRTSGVVLLGSPLRTSVAQPEVSNVIWGRRSRITHVEKVTRIANGLGIPTRLLGFHEPPASEVDEEVDWMNRRDFHKALAAILMGVGTSLELDRLKALLPIPGGEVGAIRLHGSAL